MAAEYVHRFPSHLCSGLYALAGNNVIVNNSSSDGCVIILSEMSTHYYNPSCTVMYKSHFNTKLKGQ